MNFIADSWSHLFTCLLKVVVHAIRVCCQPGLDALGDVNNVLQLGREYLMQLLRGNFVIEVNETIPISADLAESFTSFSIEDPTRGHFGADLTVLDCRYAKPARKNMAAKIKECFQRTPEI